MVYTRSWLIFTKPMHRPLYMWSVNANSNFSDYSSVHACGCITGTKQQVSMSRKKRFRDKNIQNGYHRRRVQAPASLSVLLISFRWLFHSLFFIIFCALIYTQFFYIFLQLYHLSHSILFSVLHISGRLLILFPRSLSACLYFSLAHLKLCF